jgi:hypothetical protein
MAVKTWSLRQVTTNGTPASVLWWDEAAAATAATSVTGWTVAKTAAGNYRDLSNGSEVAGFSATISPAAAVPTSDANYPSATTYAPPTLINSTDSISTLYEYNGVFPAGTWTFSFPVIAVGAGGTQDGRIGIRVYRGLRSGTAFASVTQITSARLVGTTVTNLATATAQTSTVTWAAPAFDLQNEFLIVKIGWEITGATNNNASDVLLRWGAGATIVSPTFKKFRHIIT